MESLLTSLFQLLGKQSHLIVALIFLFIGFFMGRSSKVIVNAPPESHYPLGPVPTDEETLDLEGDYFNDEIPDFESVGAPKRIPTIY